MTERIDPFEHLVSSDLAGLIPEEIREDPEKRSRWVEEALEVGLKVKLQRITGVDTGVVSRAFDEWREAIDAKIIGPDSDFLQWLDSWFNNTDSSFRIALDPENPESPLGRLRSSLEGGFEDHQEDIDEAIDAMKDMIVAEFTTMKTHLGIEAAVKEEAEKGAGKGIKFEAEVADQLGDHFRQSSDEVRGVGTTLVDGTNRKVGDVEVLIDTPVAPDLGIIIEVKAGSDYTLRGKHTLQDQMSESMKLRGAQASIAVTDRKHLKKSQNIWMDVDRYRIIVAVDRDEQDYTLLDVAYRVLRYRIVQDAAGSAPNVDSLDANEFNRLLDEIVSDLQLSQKMKSNLSQGATLLQGVRTDVVNQESRIRGKVVELQALIQRALDGE